MLKMVGTVSGYKPGRKRRTEPQHQSHTDAMCRTVLVRPGPAPEAGEFDSPHLISSHSLRGARILGNKREAAIPGWRWVTWTLPGRHAPTIPQVLHKGTLWLNILMSGRFLDGVISAMGPIYPRTHLPHVLKDVDDSL